MSQEKGMDMQLAARKVAAVFVAAMLAFAMAFVATPTKAYAAGAGTLTVESSNAAFDGKTVKAWKMFDAKANADGSAATYELAAEWNEFFTGTIKLTDDDTLSQKAYEYVAGLDTAAKKSEFALKAVNWATGKPLVATATSSPAAIGGNGKYQATFAGLDFGYYVLSPDTTAERDAMLANVTKAQEDPITLKSVFPTVDKKVEGNNHASAQVGGEVTFTLTSTLPDATDYKTYTFKFKDKMSEGLTFVDGSVKVQIQDQPDPVDSQLYEVTKGDPEAGYLVIDLKDYKTNYQQHAGKTITVTYKALINENAAVIDQDNPNKATVEYTTDPENGGTGESEESQVHTYTFGFDIDKVDGEASQTKLEGAVFELRTEDGQKIDLVKVQEGVFRPAKQGEQPVAAADDVKTDAQGKLQFVGLKEGAYKLVETKAPEGYNPLKDPITVIVTAKYGDGGVLESWKADVQGGSALDNTHVIQVANHKGTLLPETGGMGTIAFTVIGALAIIGGVVWAVRRKRNVR